MDELLSTFKNMFTTLEAPWMLNNWKVNPDFTTQSRVINSCLHLLSNSWHTVKSHDIKKAYVGTYLHHEYNHSTVRSSDYATQSLIFSLSILTREYFLEPNIHKVNIHKLARGFSTWSDLTMTCSTTIWRCDICRLMWLRFVLLQHV